MEPPRVEELGPDGAPSSSVPFDEASWVDPLSSEWVYVDADTLPSCEPSILEPVVEVAKAEEAKSRPDRQQRRPDSPADPPLLASGPSCILADLEALLASRQP